MFSLLSTHQSPQTLKEMFFFFPVQLKLREREWFSLMSLLVVHGAGLRGEVASETAVGAPDDDGSHNHVREQVGDHPAGHHGPREGVAAGDISGLDGGPVDLDDLTLTDGGGGGDVLEAAGGEGGTGAESSGTADGVTHGHSL